MCHKMQESAVQQRQEKELLRTGYSEGSGQVPEQMREIMRRNSEALEEMITKKVLDLCSPLPTQGLGS